MKNIKLFEEYHTKFAPSDRTESDNNDVYAFLTKELIDKKTNKRFPISLAHYGYQFSYSNSDELKKLKDKYPVGGKYKGKTITQTPTLSSKQIEY